MLLKRRRQSTRHEVAASRVGGLTLSGILVGMDAERVRAFVLALPHVEETHQWGDNLVFWVGDKAIGGKMFALLSLEPGGGHSNVVLSLSVGPERFNEFLENEDIIPAPYMARIHWIGLQRWDALQARELEAALTAAHAITYAKLPKRVKDTFALPAAARKKLITERRKVLKSTVEKKAAAKVTKSRKD